MMQGAQIQCSVTNEKGGMGWKVGERFKRKETVYLWLIHADVCQKPIMLICGRNQPNIVKHLSFN